jgi:hypothetical protein
MTNDEATTTKKTNKIYSVPIINTIFKYYIYNTGKFERHWLPEITEKLNESGSHCNNRY